MVKLDYECTKCQKIYSDKEYKQNAYCPKCGIHLWQRSFSPTPFKVNDVFAEFTALNSFVVAEGIVYNNVNVWFNARNTVYEKFHKKLSAKKLTEGDKWLTDFRKYICFKGNQSWNFKRAGTEALAHPEELKRLLLLLQDNKVPVDDRIRSCLQGDGTCPGVDRIFLTALLHMYWPSKYGVWGKHTDNALKKIKRTPIQQADLGDHYTLINKTLIKLASELHTSLTAVDGFMWYIAKV
ncbi:MAG: hypothetical protein GX638_06820 [Crenarchaeota archaeon]|nr:hypothetical protein [Thermoproteota archaeon]